MALVEVLLKIGGILPIKARSERVENNILKVGIIASDLKNYIIILKLFKVNYKIN